jgi:hypothetical protein
MTPAIDARSGRSHIRAAAASFLLALSGDAGETRGDGGDDAFADAALAYAAEHEGGTLMPEDDVDRAVVSLMARRLRASAPARTAQAAERAGAAEEARFARALGPSGGGGGGGVRAAGGEAAAAAGPARVSLDVTLHGIGLALARADSDDAELLGVRVAPLSVTARRTRDGLDLHIAAHSVAVFEVVSAGRPSTELVWFEPGSLSADAVCAVSSTMPAGGSVPLTSVKLTLGSVRADLSTGALHRAVERIAPLTVLAAPDPHDGAGGMLLLPASPAYPMPPPKPLPPASGPPMQLAIFLPRACVRIRLPASLPGVIPSVVPPHDWCVRHHHR